MVSSEIDRRRVRRLACTGSFIAGAIFLPVYAPVDLLSHIPGGNWPSLKLRRRQDCRIKVTKMDYEICDKYRDMAEQVIDAVPTLGWIRRSGVRIAYLRSFKEKKHGGKPVFGECRKVQDVYLPFCGYDFIITIFEMNTAEFTQNQLKILLYHELLHIGFNEKDGELTYKIETHDIEEFREIADQFGIRWSDLNAVVPDITEGGG